MKSQRDDKILEGIISGNPFVIKSFYQENLSCIRKHIMTHYGNEEDVKDIFQDAMIIIYQKSVLNLLHFNSSLEAYFYGICKNLWRNRLRRKHKIIHDTALLEDLLDRLYVSDPQNIEGKDRKDIYQKYFLKLNDSKRQLLHLSLEGKSTKEISKITGYTENYAKKKKCTSKKDLMKMIQKDPIYKELVSV
ncbi:RNA polymerase sigma factor [Aquimarina algiphila]|uniref:Sigma-70 family RNA polymerase sigma factor n=1 Tax=Aquimarina algiphila TaxID=2047982 RepID=A0A554VJ38_9FLAO|nr:sigma-70 family RNA polymerase sigma factor [Aquimarina algiphila]TSE07884.1 sigma-70 family RNA polymerase sigma factor [Aquimarina algiphila]